MKIKGRRYIVLNIDKAISREAFYSILIEYIMFFSGIIGLSLTLPSIVYMKDKILIIRTTVDGVRIIRSSIALKGNLSDINIKIINITGSFKKAKAICDSYKGG